MSINFQAGMKSLPNKTVKFQPGNQIIYRQDFSGFIGVPSDVTFTVTAIDKNRAILQAPGYGGIPYGNGHIIVFRSMNEVTK
jgi:hypothetical protein